MEQLARDARITTIYEGTTGIQALDLLGRKTMQLQGAGLQQFLKMIQGLCTEHASDASMTEFVLPLAEIAKQWGELTMEVGKKAMANADEVGAASVDYLFYSGYVALAFWWAKAVAAAEAGIGHTEGVRGFGRGFAVERGALQGGQGVADLAFGQQPATFLEVRFAEDRLARPRMLAEIEGAEEALATGQRHYHRQGCKGCGEFLHLILLRSSRAKYRGRT